MKQKMKGGPRGIILSLLDVVRNIETKDKKNSDVLKAFFASVFSLATKDCCSLGASPPSCNTRIGSRMNSHNPRGNVQHLLHTLNTHRSMGPDGIQPRVLRELLKCSSSVGSHG